VRATAVPGGRVASLQVNPRLLREGIESVCEQIIVAVNAALDGLRAKTTAQGAAQVRLAVRIFGDDMVGGLIGASYAAAQDIATRSYSSVVKGLGGFADLGRWAVGLQLPGELADLLNDLGFMRPKSAEQKLFELGQAWAGPVLDAGAGGLRRGHRGAAVWNHNTGDAVEAFKSRWSDGRAAPAVLQAMEALLG
jgi:hypothetical protein